MCSDEKEMVTAFLRIRSGLNMDAEGASPGEVVAEVRKNYALASQVLMQLAHHGEYRYRASSDREQGRQEERARIVQWLREVIGSGPASLIADQVENGDHWRPSGRSEE